MSIPLVLPCHRRAFGEKLNRMMYLDPRLTLADGDPRKVGLMCEPACVRVRYPFPDEDLTTFAARIPPKQLPRDGKLRGFFKYALRDFLPPELLRNPNPWLGSRSQLSSSSSG